MDVSIYDTERVFSVGDGVGTDGVNGAGGKRKKGEMEVGEIWRAKGVSSQFLYIRGVRESLKADDRRDPPHSYRTIISTSEYPSIISV